MVSGRECFEAWAGNHEWSDWTKPVLFASQTFAHFASIGAQSLPGTSDGALQLALQSNVRSGDGGGQRNCVVVDLPGERAIEVGAALAEQGFAPVVLFNGVASGGNAVLNHDEAIKSLIRSTIAGWRCEVCNRIRSAVSAPQFPRSPAATATTAGSVDR